MTENEISFAIRKAAFDVFNELGPGLFESVYEAAMVHVLREDGINVESQLEVPVIFRGVKLEQGFRLDLLVEDKVIVEIKSIKMLEDVHKKQLLTYLKLSNKKTWHTD